MNIIDVLISNVEEAEGEDSQEPCRDEESWVAMAESIGLDYPQD